ncbi:MAG: toxic anion resistance protein [Desulfobaccales bacterium]
MTENSQHPAEQTREVLPLVGGDKVALEKFSPEEQKKITEIKEKINVEDSVGVMHFGVEAQVQIADFSDRILSEIRAKDTGQVGDLLTNLLVSVKELNVDGLNEESFWTKVPLIGSLVNSTQKFLARYQTLNVQIEQISADLDRARMMLAKDILMLDGLYEKNLGYFKNLVLFIAAGEEKARELREKVLPDLTARAAETKDALDAQRVKDMEQRLDRFEKRIHDLKLSRMVSFQTAPQIRIIQNNNQLLAEKIQSSILNTIPLWKSQMVIAISMLRQKKALDLQRQVTETTEELLEKNIELLKESSTGIAQEMEKGIVSIDTLKKVNADLIATIDETLKIQAEGREKRAQAEQEMIKIEKDLKEKLVSLKK